MNKTGKTSSDPSNKSASETQVMQEGTPVIQEANMVQGAQATEKNQTQAQAQAQDAQIETNLARLPRISLGALFMPAVWGPAHGYWITILFYPIWIFADTCFTNAVLYGGLATLFAVLVFLGTAAIMIWFALTAGKKAYLRVADRVPLERYLKRERVWAVVSFIIALVFFVFATWYNLAFRLPAGV